MKFGDTNFIGVVNAETYQSFLDEDWELDILLQHFSNEMKKGNILVFQVTEEGIEHSWNVEVKIGTEEIVHKCFRTAVGYMKVTENQLYLADYDCLTMAAQFESEEVPDKNCLNYKVDIENGVYKVNIIHPKTPVKSLLSFSFLFLLFLGVGFLFFSWSIGKTIPYIQYFF